MMQKKAEIVAAVGAGGKSTYLQMRALEYVRAGKRAAITTTTHIRIPERAHCNGVSVYPVPEAAEHVLVYHGTEGVDTIGVPCGEGKLSAPPEHVLKRICREYDAVLVEGDGSRCMPLKLPGENEPVIPDETDEIAVVMGVQAVGRRLDIVCHRYDRARLAAAGILPKGAPIVTEDMPQKIAEAFYIGPLRERFPKAEIFFAPSPYPAEDGPFPEVTAVLMASGFGRRYGGNKLLDDLNGRPLYRHALDHIVQALGRDALIVVTQYEEIFRQAREMGLRAVMNDQAAEGISASIRLGTERALQDQICPALQDRTCLAPRNQPSPASRDQTFPELPDGAERPDPVILFFAADMPYLSAEEIRRYVRQFLWSGKTFGCMEAGPEHIMTNPGAFRLGRVPSPLMETDVKSVRCLSADKKDRDHCGGFPGGEQESPTDMPGGRTVAQMLLSLHGDRGAMRIMKQYPHEIYRYQVPEKAVTDIDVKG